MAGKVLKCHWRYFSDGPEVKTLCFHCRGVGSIPGQGTKILYATWQGKKKKKKLLKVKDLSGSKKSRGFRGRRGQQYPDVFKSLLK